MGDAAGDEGALDAFAERWGLDAGVVDTLRDLDGYTRSIVLKEFAPRGNTHDVSGKLLAFVRSIESKNQTLQAATPTVEAFVQRWGLDGTATAWLMSLPPEVCETVLEKFDPREDTHNIMGKLRSFARSVQAWQPGGQRAEPAPLRSLVAGQQDQLADFGAKWGLDDSALASFGSMPPEVQRTVIRDFDPKGDVMNVNGKVLSFARSILSRQRHPAPGPFVAVAAISRRSGVASEEAFVARWRLDDAMRQFILELPRDVRRTVMERFDPPADTRNVAGKLKSFANGILASAGTASAGEPQTWDASETTVGGGSLAIEDFAARWGLDSGDVSLLESLPDDALQTVLEQFAPRSDTRNVSAKLRAFTNTVTGGGKGTAKATLPYNAFPAQGSSPSSGSRTSVVPDRETTDFLLAWGLRDDASVSECLRRLAPAVRQRVMAEFAPGSDTRDVAGKLIGFANSVARTAVPPWTQQRTQAGLLLSPRRPAGGMTPEQFADQWQLDEGARALLRGLDSHAQATVMAEFQPRGDVRDPSGRFCAFARSVAARGSGGPAPPNGGGGGGLKRGPPVGSGPSAPPWQRRRLA